MGEKLHIVADILGCVCKDLRITESLDFSRHISNPKFMATLTDVVTILLGALSDKTFRNDDTEDLFRKM